MALTEPGLTDARPGASRMGLAARRFRANPMAMLGLVVLVLLVATAILGPHLWIYSHTDITPDLSQPPSLAHPLGTDTLGRDMLALSMRGMQQSLSIAGSVAAIACVIGTIMGVVSAYFGGWVDAGIMRLVDLVLTVPTIALAAFLGNSLAGAGVSWLGLALVLAALMWTSVARLVRGVSLSLRDMPFVRAAQVMGGSAPRIMLRHLVPNVADHIIVSTALLVGVAILSETGLSFLGFGVQPPDTSLGLLISSAQTAVLTRPWMFYAPGVLIILIVLSINYVGEGLRDAFNPRADLDNPLVAAARKGAGAPAPAAENLVEIRDFSVRFDGGTAVEGLSLDIRRGEVLALVGESGSGKSLTALSIAGLLPNQSVATGTLIFDGDDMGRLGFEGWRAYRGRRIAVILQDPATSLNPVLTIGAHFEESLRLAGPMSREAMRARAAELLEVVAIRDAATRLDQYPHQMSGGMRQRIVIALAMVHQPDLIIADEPTTALDVTVQAQVLETLAKAREAVGAAMLFITHDLAIVAGLADRVAVMKAGALVEEQDVHGLFTAPRDPYTRRLLSLAPRLDRVEFAPPVERPGPPLLQVQGLTRDFIRPRASGGTLEERRVRALDAVSFDLAPGETLGIVGESGSGKTTLLNCILGIHPPTAGSVQFEGVDMAKATRAVRREASKRMSVVFQDPYSSLDPRMTVADILAQPMRIHGRGGEARARAEAMLDRVRLPRAALGRFPHEFSGGQRQRIAIARALMLDPRLIVLDEPVSSLDVSIQQEILELLVDLKREAGVAYLLVAHDLAVVAGLADRIMVMTAGEAVETGTAEQIIRRPAHAYTRRLLSAVPVPDPDVERARRG
ncbi:dipeptide ABC transporter ATP-binding protein [Pseudoroseicyclus sp. H15]